MPVEGSVLGEADEALLAPLQAEAERALIALDLEAAELSLVLCDDAEIRPLNRDWRGLDEPTDVLSFPQEEIPSLGEGGPPRVLGDVVISVQTARRQAQALGHSLAVELRVLLIHGLCHLLGHDHQDPQQTERMRAEEARLLAALGGGAQGLVQRAAPVD